MIVLDVVCCDICERSGHDKETKNSDHYAVAFQLHHYTPPHTESREALHAKV